MEEKEIMTVIFNEEGEIKLRIDNDFIDYFELDTEEVHKAFDVFMQRVIELGEIY